MVWAILHNGHNDLGVLHTAQGVQAVFEVGEEWDNAIRLVLRCITAKLRLSVSYAPIGTKESDENVCKSQGRGNKEFTHTKYFT